MKIKFVGKFQVHYYIPHVYFMKLIFGFGLNFG